MLWSDESQKPSLFHSVASAGNGRKFISCVSERERMRLEKGEKNGQKWKREKEKKVLWVNKQKRLSRNLKCSKARDTTVLFEMLCKKFVEVENGEKIFNG